MLKNCISIAGTAALVFLSTALSAAAADLTPDNPASKEFLQRTNANRSRIEAMAKEAGVSSDIHFFAVPPMSEIMRRAEVFPEDGWYNECLRAAAAQDEYEPVSFQLFSFTDKKDVSVTVSDLKSKDGFSIPAKNLDLKVVKIWYQNGNGWNSYFSDVGLRLVPELLLKDENMVKVDTEKVANYARIRKDGKDSYVWISAPRGLEPGFNAVQKGFEDAEVMQNVSLEKNQFKQFFVTIHVPENQNPGVYSGTITVHADKSGAVSLPLKVRVLPFRLPAPATYQKLDMPVICSCMGWYGLSRFR